MSPMQKIVLGALFLIIAVTLYSLTTIIPFSASEKAPDNADSAADSGAKQPKLVIERTFSENPRKNRFLKTIVPVVESVKKELDAEHAKAKRLMKKPQRSAEETAWLQAQMQRYNVTGYPCLLRSMQTHPVSLVVAQAALETGWGSSRFYQEANNVFGIWSYNQNEPRMAASEHRGSKTVYVKKFASLENAIRGYFMMIGKGYAYSGFRKARTQTQNPFELMPYLRRYSELRDEYVARLYYVIKSNKLYRFDQPSFKPIALAQIIPEYVALKREAKEKSKDGEPMVALNEVKVEQENIDPIPCEEADITLQTSEAMDVPPEG
jgi:Bax protein